MPSLLNFWLPCILMGVGIAIDIAIATVVKFRDNDLSFKNWTVRLTVTHVTFPAFGYYLFWGLSVMFTILAPVLGIVGFLFVAAFIYEVICKSAGFVPIIGISDKISEFFGLSETDTRRWIAVLAVSWDALWSGPAKSAQAEAGAWSTHEVIFSFFVAGLTVAAIAQLSLLVAKLLRKINFHNAKRLAHFNFWGKLVELSVIGGFGVLSLWQGLTGGGNLYEAIVISGTVLFLIFTLLKHRLMERELDEATEAVEA